MANHKHLVGLVAGCSVFAVVQALAGVAVAADAASGSSGLQLEELVVTARKTQENIIRTPVAISALTATDLKDKNITDLKTLGQFAPSFHQTNLSFGRNDRGYQSYAMRGIYGGDGQQRQPVRMFLDGAPLSTGMIAGLDGLERVEIVRGPQSAYFGRSTFAGAVNFITRVPGTTPQFNASADFAGFGYHELKASAEGPLVGDMLTGRLSIRSYKTDGAFTNSYDGSKFGAQQTNSISASLYAKPTEALRVKVFGQYWRDKDGPSAQARYDITQRNCNPSGAAVLNFTCGQINSVAKSQLYWNTSFSPTVISTLTNAPAVTHPDSDLINHLGMGRKAWQVVSSFEYDLPQSWMLSGNVGLDNDQYRIILDNYQVRTPSTYVVETQNILRDFSGEIRLQSARYFDLVKGMIGVNYLDTSVNGQAIAYRGPPGATDPTAITAGLLNASDSTRYYSRTFGLFGSLHFDLTDQLKFDLEGREQFDHVVQKIIPDRFSSPGVLQVAATKTFRTFTPKASLSYQVDPDTMVYVSYAGGSRPGQFNTGVYSLPAAARAAVLAQSNVNLAVPPERLDMYEAGLKSELFEHRLRVLLSTYYGRWYRRQVTAPIYYIPPGSQTLVLVNAISGSSNVNLTGVEGEAHFRLSQALTLEGTVAYNKTDIRRSYCASCLANTGTGNFVGNSLPGYAPFTASASVIYSHEFTDKLDGFARLDYLHSSRQYEQEDNVTWTAPSNVFNARVGVKMDHYMLELYGTNIFNNKSPISIFTQANLISGGNTIEVAPQAPGTAGIRLTVSY